MIVCLAGPSGSGKTTLAKALAEHFNWKFKENSAGLIISNTHKDYMAAQFGYNGDLGQAEVINKSHKDPLFGLYFQQTIVEARIKLLHDTLAMGKNAIYDRGPLDPIVFYLNQVVNNFDEKTADRFFESCMPGLRNVDLIIRVPLQNPNCEIENNGSRIANWYFQMKIDLLYDQAIHIASWMVKKNHLLFENKPIRVTRTSTWDWGKRLTECIKMIEAQ